MNEVERLFVPTTDVTIRSASKREIDVRLAPFGTVIETVNGPETIEPGAFRDVDPDGVWLMEAEHGVRLGMGQDGGVVPVRRRTGRATRVWEDETAGYATFRVAKTSEGDDTLNSIAEGLYDGVSIEMGRDRKVRTEKRNGRRHHFVEFADLKAASPTYQPAYAEARVLAVRSQQEDAPVATDDKAATEATPEQPKEDRQQVTQMRVSADQSLESFRTNLDTIVTSFGDKLGDRIAKLEEQSRSSFNVPGAPSEKKKLPGFGEWMDTAIKLLSGDRMPDEQFRVWQDIITTDNAGVVPDAYSDNLLGFIDPSRPFMATTTRLPTPSSGMNLVTPIITQRPAVAEQAEEKDEIASQKTIIGTETYPWRTFAGGADLSLQILRRSDPSYYDLFIRLLAEAYALETEDAAVAALITAVNDGGPEPATALNPNSLSLGASFQASYAVVRRGPDTIWLSSEAVAEFIDAKASGTNAPLYSDLAANFTAAGGPGGTIQGLRPVHVPALDAKGAYAIVGPSTGYAWAEDGTYTLTVDVPRLAGRDISIVGMVAFAPWYPAAFTLYNVAS